MSKSKFTKTWSNLTKIGALFGISSIALGKILVEEGFRDPISKNPTDQAVSHGWCISTPLKTGEVFYMWNIKLVSDLLLKKFPKLSAVDIEVNRLTKLYKQAHNELDNGNDKLGYMMLDSLFEDTPPHILTKVKDKMKAIDDSL